MTKSDKKNKNITFILFTFYCSQLVPILDQSQEKNFWRGKSFWTF